MVDGGVIRSVNGFVVCCVLLPGGLLLFVVTCDGQLLSLIGCELMMCFHKLVKTYGDLRLLWGKGEIKSLRLRQKLDGGNRNGRKTGGGRFKEKCEKLMGQSTKGAKKVIVTGKCEKVIKGPTPWGIQGIQ